jgi:hypothetical protein
MPPTKVLGGIQITNGFGQLLAEQSASDVAGRRVGHLTDVLFDELLHSSKLERQGLLSLCRGPPGDSSTSFTWMSNV